MITLTQKEFPAFIHGILYTESENGFHICARMTKEQLETYRSDDVFYCRAHHTGGVHLECFTDAQAISFSYALDFVVATGSVDVWINGMPVGIYPFGDKTEGTFTCTLPKGKKRLTLYYPTYCRLKTGDILLDGTYADPIQHRTRVLWYGDSITQGAGAQDVGSMMAGGSYENLVTRILDWDSLNQAIGGLYYDSRVIIRPDGYTPDKIVTSLGTNGANMSNYAECAAKFFLRLAEVYPEVPVLVITPLWHAQACPEFPSCTAAVRQIISAYPNITPVDGETLVPHLPCMYGPDLVHPYLLGHKYYAENLISEIRRSGFDQ